MNYRLVLCTVALAVVSFAAQAQNSFPTRGGATAPGMVMMCKNAAGLFVSCNSPNTAAIGGNNFPTPGGATAPGVVLLCDNGSGLFVPCTGGGGGGGGGGGNTPVSIALSTTSANFATTANANSFVATINVMTAGSPYAGTLTLGGADAAKFALSNGGVYPTNLMVGPANICTTGSPCTYNISVTAP